MFFHLTQFILIYAVKIESKVLGRGSSGTVFSEFMVGKPVAVKKLLSKQ
jgi:hypothetical protein